VDGYQDTNVEYLMDFSRTWPFPDNCLDGIFCEHVFEHFDMNIGMAVLREAFRVLQPGQCLRIIVPDGEKILKSYVDNPSVLREHRPGETPCAMEAVNSYFRQRYDHQWIYDWELLEHQLEAAGFAEIGQVSFGKGGVSQPVILDDQAYAWESLYVEALKPRRPDQIASEARDSH
jgi:predicted SAM-dependent methyltransferase